MKVILSFVGVAMLFGVFCGGVPAQKLDKGVGPYGEFWKPIPTQRYWAPDYFYSPPEEPKGVYAADECTLCHKALNPGLVKAWAESSHANLDKLLDYQKEKLAEIEKTLGRKLTKVGCIDCHGKVGAEKLDHEKELIMPSSTLCGECHKQEYQEFESEKQYGIPDWKPGRESHAKAYDANLDVDVWAAVDKNIVQGCDMCHSLVAPAVRRPSGRCAFSIVIMTIIVNMVIMTTLRSTIACSPQSTLSTQPLSVYLVVAFRYQGV